MAKKSSQSRPYRFQEYFSLKGKLALVTGGGQGLGLAIARGLAGAGAALVINDLQADRAESAVLQVRRSGGTANSLVFDVTSPRSVRRASRLCLRTMGPPDIIVNNAGIHRYGELTTLAFTDWQRVLDVNLTGAFLVAQSFAQSMIRRGSGKIINMCSLMSEAGRPTTGNYMAAKGGLKMLTKSMAIEWGPHGIQANGIGPGYIASDMTRHLVETPAFDQWVKKRTPLGRWGTTNDLVGAAIFLSASASDFVNGHILYVDGGFLAAL